MITTEMWEEQLAFNSNFFTPEKLEQDPDEKMKWNNFYTLALTREVGEVLDTTNWKIHRAKDKPEIRSNTLEELIDCMKYLMTLMQVHGFTLEEVQEEYWRKSAVVEQRYLQEMKDAIKGKNNIVGVDIDGTLADYPASYVEFMGDVLRNKYPEYYARYLKIRATGMPIDNYDIGAFFELPYDVARDVKDLYRQTGQKRFIGVCPGAKVLLDALKAQGYTVVLLTARPYEVYKRMFADTISWLRNADLQYDGLIFDENKEERLVKEFGAENVKFFVDDVVGNVNAIAEKGIRCYLVNKPYNLAKPTKDNVVRVENLLEVLERESIRY